MKSESLASQNQFSLGKKTLAYEKLDENNYACDGLGIKPIDTSTTMERCG